MTDNSSIDLSLTNIWHTWRAFRAGKKPSRAILEFEVNLENNLINLCLTLNDGSYQHGGYDHKILNEKKRRDIAVATVEDRIVHRLFYDYLVPKVDMQFDPDIWSGRKDKGLHKSLNRIAYLADKYPNLYVWRADIKKFFDNVDHSILKSCLNRYVTDTKTENLLDKVISSHTINSQPASHGTGIPIGNLTSQIFANIYLNEFDRYVRHALKPLAYIRYGDDFLLFAPTENEAVGFKRSSSKWLLENLHLKLHDKNNIIIQPKNGIHILGHWIYPKHHIIVDKTMRRKMYINLTTSNASTYKSMKTPKRAQNVMSHLLHTKK